MKHNIGDIVTIRKDLVHKMYHMDGDPPSRYAGYGVAPDMYDLAGKTVKIVGIRYTPTEWASSSYILCIDNGMWKWTDEMLDG
jgi:hypothetical protein